MTGQQGVEVCVESMLANQHTVGSGTITRRAGSAHFGAAGGDQPPDLRQPAGHLFVQTDRRGRCVEMSRQASKISP
jgi:hypothetical protein